MSDRHQVITGRGGGKTQFQHEMQKMKHAVRSVAFRQAAEMCIALLEDNGSALDGAYNAACEDCAAKLRARAEEESHAAG